MDSPHQFVHLADECLTVMYDVPVGPPVRRVGVLRTRGKDGTPPTDPLRIVPGEILQDAALVVVVTQAALIAVDLEGIHILVAAREAGHFETADGPVLETGQEERGVIYRNLAFLSRIVDQRSFRAEGLPHAVHRADIPHEVVSEVDDVSADVA